MIEKIPEQWLVEAVSCQERTGVDAKFSLAVILFVTRIYAHTCLKEILENHNPFGILRHGVFQEFATLTDAFDAFALRVNVHQDYAYPRSLLTFRGVNHEFIEAFGKIWCMNEQMDGWDNSVYKYWVALCDEI